jgi:hypothetical protein
MGGENGQLALAGAAGQPGQRLPECRRLAVVLPVLAGDPGHFGQLGPGQPLIQRLPQLPAQRLDHGLQGSLQDRITWRAGVTHDEAAGPAGIVLT